MKIKLIVLFLLLPVLCYAGDVWIDGQSNEGHIIKVSGDTLAQQPILNFTGLVDYVVTDSTIEINISGDGAGGGGGSVSDTAYGISWNGVTDTAPSKNAVYDKIETLGGGHDAVTVTDTTSLDLTLTGQDIQGNVNDIFLKNNANDETTGTITAAGFTTSNIITADTVITNLLDATGAVDMDYGSADITDHTFTTDGAGNSEIVLPNDSIGDTEIDWGTGAAQVSPTDFANEDIGDITITGGSWAVKNDSHDHSAAGSTVTINAADIIDKNTGTDITADLEEEVTEGSLADSTIVSADIKDGTITGLDLASNIAITTTNTVTASSLVATGTDQSTITEGLIVNDGSGGDEDDDFIVETNNQANFFEIDAGDETLRIGDGTTNYSQFSTTGAFTQAGSATLTLQDGSDLVITANANAAPFLANNGDTGTGAFDFGGTTDFEIENGANPTVDTAGEIAIDTTANTGSTVRFYTNAEYSIPAYQTKSFVLISPVATDDYPIWRTPHAITIRTVRLLCVGGTNVVGQLTECDANGANCAVVDSSDITSAAGITASDDASLSNPSIDAGDYVGWNTTSISGTPTSATVTFEYTVDAVN